MISKFRAGFAAALGLIVASAGTLPPGHDAHAQALEIEPDQVIGYAQPEFLGASQEWRLPPDKPFLAIGSLEGPLSSLASIKLGADVGVTLFDQRGFATRDEGCQPVIGSEARPDLLWRGPTAHFEPAAAGNGEALAQAHLPRRFASLLIYRRDQGPPPGVLLMDRLIGPTFGCSNPLYTTRYQRLFVPPPEAPARGHCVSLVERKMPRSDRAVLLLPEDFDDAYRGLDHRFSIALFDGANCEGAWAIIPSYGQPKRDFDLRDVDFRDRARSLLVVYDGGLFDPLLDPPQAPQNEQPAVATSKPPPEPSAPPAPEIADSEAPIAAAEPAAPEAATPPVPDSALPPAESATRQPRAAVSSAVDPEPAAPQVAEESPPPVAAPEPVAPQVPEQSAPPIAAPAPVAPQVAEESPPTVAAPEPVEPQIAEPVAPQVATPEPPAPPAEPLMAEKGAPQLAAASGPRSFSYPVHEVYRLNYCLNWGKDCGAPAADAFCKAKGFASAKDFKLDENIGNLFPTIVMGEDRVCASFVCDGFEEITCTQ